LTDTPAVRGDLTPERIEAARQAIPIGRLGKPADIADTIAFLASTRAGYIAGAVIAPTAVKLERTPDASN
jgi:3-oxoacyl-[acyl-carrier protein] reductase